MDFIYEAPFQVKGLIFGLSRIDVRNKLGENFESFKRGPFSKTKVDFYKEIGLFVNYDEGMVVQSYEIVTPAKFIIDGVDVFSVSAKKAVELIRTIDSKLIEDSSGFEAPNIGVEGYLNGYFENKDTPLEGIMLISR